MSSDLDFMRRALDLAARGRGRVEPNPMVGCVIVRDRRVIGEGWHQCFGGEHAEVHALAQAGDAATGATCYVTLEPCSHFGKTPPCTEALIAAGISRIVVAMQDPSPEVRGKGIARLKSQHVEVEVGLCEEQARQLNAPYLYRIEKKRPWIIAKWAMTLDGKIASKTCSSQWISSSASLECVHDLRSCMDAILVGIRTVEQDDPLLTVRARKPTGTHIPLRIVLDTQARISPLSRLVTTARDFPLLIVVGPDAPPARTDALRDAGCEIFTWTLRLPGEVDEHRAHSRSRDARTLPRDGAGQKEREKRAFSESALPFVRERFNALFTELVERGCTNLLIEGGAFVLGSLFDLDMIDEVHVFVAPKLIGGAEALSPIAGIGLCDMSDALRLADPQIRLINQDIYISGKIGDRG